MILHVDLDAFFASVEQRDNPRLRGKPVVVGGPISRGVVSTASYEARKYGVHSGMPMFRAKVLCPWATFLPPDFVKYQKASEQFLAICSSYSPLIEQVSLDEVYMDLAGTERLYTPQEAARQIQTRVKSEIGITCSVGIASQKTVAKIASGFKKPYGITEIPKGGGKKFLAPLSIDKIPGCGKKTSGILKHYHINKIGDLAKMRQDHARLLLGENGVYLWQVANGIDHAVVTTPGPAKSISRSTTLSFDTNNKEFIENMLFYLAQQAAMDLRQSNVLGKCISVVIKTAQFEFYSRQQTLTHYIMTAHEIFKIGKILIGKLWDGRTKLRLVGVSISNFNQLKHQFQLFETYQFSPQADGPLAQNERWLFVEQTMDKIRNKFGFQGILPASLLRFKRKTL